MARPSTFLEIRSWLDYDFLSAQMALVSTFFQMFIELGMYNFYSVLAACLVRALSGITTDCYMPPPLKP